MNDTIPVEVFNSVYNDNYRKLLRYAKGILKNEHTAEESVQEVFLKLCKQDYSKVSGHVNQWLYTVCHNHSLKLLKRQNRFVQIFDDESLVEDRDPSEELEFQEKVKAVFKFMKKLNKNQIEVLKCRFYDDLSYEQTGKKVKITSGNVGFIQNRSLNKLHDLISKELSR